MENVYRWIITTQCTLITLHPNEYIKGLLYYLLAVNIDRCMESFITVNDISSKVCVSNKIADLNLSAFNVITGINESKY